MAISIWVSIYNFYKSYTSKSPRRKEIKGKNSAEKEEADISNFSEKNTPVENIINETTFSEAPEIINLPPLNASVENIENKTETFEPSEIILLPLKEAPPEDRESETELNQATETINLSPVEGLKEDILEVVEADTVALSPVELPVEDSKNEALEVVIGTDEVALPPVDLAVEAPIEDILEVVGKDEVASPTIDLTVEDILEVVGKDEVASPTVDLAVEDVLEVVGKDTLNVPLSDSITEGVEESVKSASTIDAASKSDENEEEDFVTLESEMTTIQKYLASEKQRLGEKLDYSLDIEADSLNYKIPVAIIQSLAENALQRNIEQITHTFYLHIQSFVYDGFLTIELKISSQPTEQTVTLAVSTIDNTMKKLASQFGENGFFNIENDGENEIVATVCVPVMS